MINSDRFVEVLLEEAATHEDAEAANSLRMAADIIRLQQAEIESLRAALASRAPAPAELQPQKPEKATKVQAKRNVAAPLDRAGEPSRLADRVPTVEDRLPPGVVDPMSVTAKFGSRSRDPRLSMQVANAMMGRLSYVNGPQSLAVWERGNGRNHPEWGLMTFADQSSVRLAWERARVRLGLVRSARPPLTVLQAAE